MDQTSRILLIDDDEESRHDLETVLAFIGEQAIPATSNYWQSPAMESVGKSTDIEVVIIGVCEQSDLTILLSEIHEWESGAPFILIGSHDISSSLDSDLNAHIAARLDSELRHQQLRLQLYLNNVHVIKPSFSMNILTGYGIFTVSEITICFVVSLEKVMPFNR